MRIHYYDKKGRAIGPDECGDLFKSKTYARIKQDILPNGKWVSTIWLGLNHQFGSGPPLIFETMVFPKCGEWSELDCDRYSTLKEARAGHEAMVKKWTSKED
jgi:hypothetical protein